jgi:hypothetical protein
MGLVLILVWLIANCYLLSHQRPFSANQRLKRFGRAFDQLPSFRSTFASFATFAVNGFGLILIWLIANCYLLSS